jgi:hypothetical protein
MPKNKKPIEKNFAVGQRVFNDTYGGGVITDRSYGRNGSENYGVKFDNGGPQGWASKSTHDVADLVPVN